ncbi:MAG TPA: hypothetical protein VET23_06100 [Chitinophagaceae bacterium]|nr:hypothetical protein [Chitinophagaceae bacterium]
MRYKLFFLLLFGFYSSVMYSQLEQKGIKIVDTLTPQEKKLRNPVILKSELDSLIKLHDASVVKTPLQEPVKEQKNNNNTLWLLVALCIAAVVTGSLIWLFYQQQKKFTKISDSFRKQLQYLELYSTPSANGNGGEN